MAFDFPASPQTGTIFVQDNFVYTWNGYAWINTGSVAGGDVTTTFVQRAGDTMTGPLTLSGAPTQPLQAATRKYVDDRPGLDQATADARYVNITGDSMAGPLVLAGAPIAAAEAATKGYVDNAVSGITAAHGDVIGPATAVAGNLAIFYGTSGKIIMDGGSSIVSLTASLNAALASGLATKVERAGDTMTGALVLADDPAAPLQAATKQYVDTRTASTLPTGGIPGQALVINPSGISAWGAPIDGGSF